MPVLAPAIRVDKRTSTFDFCEEEGGKNVLSGLVLHEEVIDHASEQALVAWIDEQVAKRNKLSGATFLQSTFTTYSNGRKMTRRGRQVLQYGSFYDYQLHVIDADKEVEAMPAPLEQVIDALVAQGVMPADARPDTCIVNIYDPGTGIPPHVDDLVYPRPFCTVSLLSDSPILFGSYIRPLGGNRFDAPVALHLPRRSVLVLSGVGADETKHAIPPVKRRRISLTFRRMPQVARDAVLRARHARAVAEPEPNTLATPDETNDIRRVPLRDLAERPVDTHGATQRPSPKDGAPARAARTPSWADVVKQHASGSRRSRRE